MKMSGSTIRGEPAICKKATLEKLMFLIEPKADEKRILSEFLKLHSFTDIFAQFPELGLSTETELKLAALSIITEQAGGTL